MLPSRLALGFVLFYYAAIVIPVVVVVVVLALNQSIVYPAAAGQLYGYRLLFVEPDFGFCITISQANLISALIH